MFKIGTDICSVKRITNTYNKYGKRFLRKILTDSEYQYVVSNKKLRSVEILAGRFAAKEAVAKALGVGWRGIHWKEVEIVRHASGAPSVVLHGRAKLLAKELNLNNFEVSLSHERDFAIALVVAYTACPD